MGNYLEITYFTFLPFFSLLFAASPLKAPSLNFHIWNFHFINIIFVCVLVVFVRKRRKKRDFEASSFMFVNDPWILLGISFFILPSSKTPKIFYSTLMGIRFMRKYSFSKFTQSNLKMIVDSYQNVEITQ